VAAARALGGVGLRHAAGFDSDIVVTADLAFFYRLWLGHVDYDTALRSGSVVVDGLPALVREFPRWLMWSPMARFVRERQRATEQASMGLASNHRRPSSR
jgi:hypothetical protein